MTLSTKLFAAGALLLGLGVGHADAAMMVYTERVVATGTLGSESFTDAEITISGKADTAAVLSDEPGIYYSYLTLTVTVAGLGSGTFTDATIVVSNQIDGLGGFGDSTTGLFILGNSNADFAGYDLTSAIGPLFGNPQFNHVASFETTAGAFSITRNLSQGSFTAELAAVPEPSSIALCGIAALAGFGGLLLRRKAA